MMVGLYGVTSVYDHDEGARRYSLSGLRMSAEATYGLMMLIYEMYVCSGDDCNLWSARIKLMVENLLWYNIRYVMV